ncbi:MAG: hypothetical protein LBO00_06545 [Zoogloeaceae bacterium]|jgi:hypothetical protein|nr:hypothetical protein [Zoogloeaceae bacterium]
MKQIQYSLIGKLTEFRRSICLCLLLLLPCSGEAAMEQASGQKRVCVFENALAQFAHLVKKQMSKAEIGSHLMDDGRFEISRYKGILTKKELLRHFNKNLAFLFPDARSYKDLKSFVAAMEWKCLATDEEQEKAFHHDDKRYVYQLSIRQEQAVIHIRLHVKIETQDDWSDEIGPVELSHIYFWEYKDHFLRLKRIVLAG